MNKSIRTFIAFLLVASVAGSFPSCDGTSSKSPDKSDLAVIESSPAIALTIGWYLPLDYLQKIIGPDFTPKVAKADTLGVMKLVITSGQNYYIEGNDKGPFRSAVLQIEVEKVGGLFKRSPKESIDHYYICPVTIVSGSLPMAESFHNNGFVHEVSNVSLKITESDERINVEANIKSGENSIKARCFFEDLPVDENLKSMTVNQTRPLYKYFYGAEKVNRYTNGKGRIDHLGTTLLTSLGIQNMPYFFVLDRNVSWSYDFGE